MSKLQDLYNFIQSSNKLGLTLPEDIVQQVNEMEEQIIKEEILPVLENNIEPTLKQIKRELVLVVDYKPGEPISVSLSRKRNITQLIEDAKLMEPDPQATHKDYGKREKPLERMADKTILRVTMPDGRVIQDKIAKRTFVQVIERVGIMRVREVGLSFCHVPIVSNRLDSKYGKAQEPVGNGFYVMTHSSTFDKKKQLDKIAEALGLNLKVEILNSDNAVVELPSITNQTSGERQLYSFNGGLPLNKRHFVLEVVKDYLWKHPQITFKQLESVFDKSLQGGYGVVRELSVVQKRIDLGYSDAARYFMEEPLVAADGVKFVVSHQWGSDNFPRFVAAMRKVGYNINEL